MFVELLGASLVPTLVNTVPTVEESSCLIVPDAKKKSYFLCFIEIWQISLISYQILQLIFKYGTYL